MEVREIRVRPPGRDSEVERYELSDIDHTMPKMYVHIAEVFELPPDACRSDIVESMTWGLAFALGEYPILAGVLRTDASNSRMWVSKKRDSTVGLFVKDSTTASGCRDLPSFEYLEANDFPVQLIDGHKVLPQAVTKKQVNSPLAENAANDDDDATIISAFQITFIDGGLIVGAAIHHSCSDGPGCNGFLTTWAENAAAASRGEPFKPIDRANTNRDRLSAPKPSAARWRELDGKFPSLKSPGTPFPDQPPVSFKMPKLKTRMWHVPRSRAAKLKAECTPPQQQQQAEEDADHPKWVSTYDCIISLFWKTMTRAKVPLLQPDMSREAVLVHAANTRHLLDPPLPDRFLGNAVAVPRATLGSLEELLAADSLPRAAAAVRASIRAITPRYVAELAEWVAGLEEDGSRLHIAIAADAFLGPDLSGSSWQAMTPYDHHDFGFGLPRALRWPHPQFEGSVFFMPSRAGVKTRKNGSFATTAADAAAVAAAGLVDDDEGVEICVCLEEGCHERLVQDAELLRYAQPRGWDA